MSEQQPSPPADVDLDTALAREALRRYALTLGDVVRVSGTVEDGPHARSGRVAGATSDVLIIEPSIPAGTRTETRVRIPWRALGTIITTPQSETHPGL